MGQFLKISFFRAGQAHSLAGFGLWVALSGQSMCVTAALAELFLHYLHIQPFWTFTNPNPYYLTFLPEVMSIQIVFSNFNGNHYCILLRFFVGQGLSSDL